MKYIKAEIEKDQVIFINPDKIIYVTENIGISGSEWTGKLKTEIRYMTYRLDVAYSQKLPHELETIEI